MIKAYTCNQLENIQPGETFIYDLADVQLRLKAMEMYERGLAVLTSKNLLPGADQGVYQYYITGVKPGTIRRMPPLRPVPGEKRLYVPGVRKCQPK